MSGDGQAPDPLAVQGETGGRENAEGPRLSVTTHFALLTMTRLGAAIASSIRPIFSLRSFSYRFLHVSEPAGR